jgi:hypothetical protein
MDVPERCAPEIQIVVWVSILFFTQKITQRWQAQGVKPIAQTWRRSLGCEELDLSEGNLSDGCKIFRRTDSGYI